MADSTIALAILAAVIVVFAINRLPVGIVAIGTALVLWASGLLTFDEAVSGFGDPVVIFIATLFVMSEAIDASGLTTWMGQKVVKVAGEGIAGVLVAVMVLCAGLTALISLNGSVAALLPMAVMLAMRIGEPPSSLLMPMAYAGSAGSMLVLMGSPVNVIVSDASHEAGLGAFGFFEFGIIGLPILIATVVVSTLISRRVLPVRSPVKAPPDLSGHAEALAEDYDLRDGFYRLRVRPTSPLLGMTIGAVDLNSYPSVRISAAQMPDKTPRDLTSPVEAGDVLVMVGAADDVSRLAVDKRLAVAMTPLSTGGGTLVSREAGVVEVVVPPRSPLIGETVFAGMRRSAGLVILALQRYGDDQGNDPIEVKSGDSMLVYGDWTAIEGLIDDSDVLVVDSPDLLRRQAAPLSRSARVTAVIVVAMVALLASGAVPPAAAGLLVALALVFTGAVGSAQAYRAVSWETVVLVGGLIPLSTAIQHSGAAERIADAVLQIAGTGSPVILMTVLFVLTSILGLVISNTATILIVLPIALAAAHETGYSARPILMLAAVASSAALLTPVQTPGNMMIMAPAGYRFGDYWRLGLPLAAVWLAISLVVIPIAWPFTP